ncbi:cobyrinic acid a,c-diamide synthase (plasmid) [Nostoc sp. NIES-3756]|uniref:MinD/ParA family ATP-binding protein n=1 Tax=Nostoc sp. NIES-3756 TaxID=1751286 RepID=UPI0007210F84|nr:MinD/ParA family protein [Nostoc sp. NIES-3756]BAT56921.1 cobyrinic acid a,c-diamide synthase [Nostoc sp. NIES-3756]
MSKIVSVHSFRGGTGKSNMTANLAATIARYGHRVGIVDTDIQSPGIHVIFGFDEDTMTLSLNDYLWGHCDIEDTAYDVTSALKGTGKKDSAIYLIPSSINLSEITKIIRDGYDVGLLHDGFHELVDKLNLEYLFIDTHPGLNEETLLSITISDALIIILRPDYQDFQGTAVAVDVARQLEVPELLLIVNKALPTLDFQTLQEQMEAAYDGTVAGIVPFAEEVVQLASSDIFCLRYPHHPFSLEVEAIAKKIRQ